MTALLRQELELAATPGIDARRLKLELTGTSLLENPRRHDRRSLGLRVLAWGVETLAQRALLFGHGCDAYQG